MFDKMKGEIVRNKSMLFAIRIVNLFKVLKKERKEFVMSKQVLRSGTSIGANIREAEFAESKLDFIHKLAIAQKECNETIYWLELLQRTDYLSKEEFDSINMDAVEMMRLITSSIKTAKRSLNSNH
jgi:four helix bundle protein